MANYNLSAGQVGYYGVVSRQLRIKWSANLGFEATLVVTRGGDGNRVFSKSYLRTATSDDIIVDVPWYGEFKVELQLNSPAIGSQVVYPTVKMVGTQNEPTFVYNAAAVEKAKTSEGIVIGVTALAGTIKIVGTILSVLFGSTVLDTSRIDFPIPKVGDKIDITTSASASGGADIKTTYTEIAFTDKNGTYQSQRTITKLSAVAYVPWNFAK